MRLRPPRSVSAALALALGSSMLAGAARAESEPASSGFAPAPDAVAGFGAAGQLALSMGSTAGEYFAFHKGGGAWQLALAPAADYFIAPHVSVGGVLAYGHSSGGSGTNSQGTDTFRIEARAGYVFALNERLGLWPLGGLALDHVSANHASTSSTFVTVNVPLLYHLAPHLFVGGGPTADFNLTGPAGNEYGLEALLGGWF
jgi:hypothetical protein